MGSGRIVMACYGLSGLTCLTYEVIWNELYLRLVRSPESSNALALGMTMGGMALGNFVGGRFANSSTEPLRLYGKMEILSGIVVFAIAAFVGFGLHTSLPVRSGLLLLTALPFVFLGFGAPLLSRYFVSNVSEVGSRLGRLVFVHTLGALVACVLGTLFFLSHFGVVTTLIVAGMINVLTGSVLCSLWSVRAGSVSEPSVRQKDGAIAGRARVYASREQRVVLLLVFLGGAFTMSYELSWAAIIRRSAAPHLPVFPMMLFTVIAGLGIGGLGAARFMASDRGHAMRALGVCQLALVLTASALELVTSSASGFGPFATGDGRELLTISDLFFATSGRCLLPAVLIGFSAPLASRIRASDEAHVGSGVGTVLAGATIGNLLGALIVGFWALPRLGPEVSFCLTLTGSAVIGTTALLAAERSAPSAYEAVGEVQ